MKRTAKSSRSPIPPATIEGLDAPIEVRRHPSARRLTLRVSRTRRAVIVTLPVQCDLGEAGTLIDRNLDWVRERLGSLPVPVPFRHGAFLPVRGVPHEIVLAGGRATARGGVVQRAQSDGRHHPVLAVSVPSDKAACRVREWLFREATHDLEAQVAQHAAALTSVIKVRPNKIVVRDQTSRWGSCSTTGVLSFSWRLVLAPPFILDYVAAHEVAHLAEMNHGPRFWALVHRIMPRVDEAKAWLQVYGLDLHRYGAESAA